MASEFQCPGEEQPISESVHLGRLTSFYPACRDCPHRHATDPLGKRTVKQIERARHFAPQPPVCDSAGIHGSDRQQFTPQFARQLAAAFGVGLRQHTRHHPQVVIAGDGRPLLAEFVAAAAAGLRWAGCQVFETGAATAPLLTMASGQIGRRRGLAAGQSGGERSHHRLEVLGALRPAAAGRSDRRTGTARATRCRSAHAALGRGLATVGRNGIPGRIARLLSRFASAKWVLDTGSLRG